MTSFFRPALGLPLLLLFACNNQPGENAASADASSENLPSAAVPAETDLAQQFADSVLLNGAIYTVDAAQPRVEAVAMRDGRYVFAGSSADARQYVGPETQVTDLAGKMAMPGINDAHVHPVMGATQSLYECQFPIESNPDQIVDALRACIKKDPGAG